MKKYIIALFAVLTLAVSCQNFLTEDPVMSQSTELTLSDYRSTTSTSRSLSAR